MPLNSKYESCYLLFYFILNNKQGITATGEMILHLLAEEGVHNASGFKFLGNYNPCAQVGNTSWLVSATRDHPLSFAGITLDNLSLKMTGTKRASMKFFSF